MATNTNRTKIVKKSTVWAKHGNHATALYFIRGQEKKAKKRPAPDYCSTVHELFGRKCRRRKKKK